LGLEEGTGGTAADTSGNGNDGTINGATWSTEGDTPSGKGYSLNLDGNDYVDCGNSSTLEMGTNDWTVTVWIKTSSTANQTFVTNGAGSNSQPGYRFSYSSSADYLWLIFGNGITRVYPNSSSGLGITDGNWHFLAVSVDRSEKAYVYFDGSFDRSEWVNSLNGEDIGSSTNTFIGYSSYGLNGLIDEVHIYAQALTSAQIKKLYAEGKARHLADR
jgi:hypothetical protein